MKEIFLNSGKVAIIDDGDFELVSAYHWSTAIHNGTWYVSAPSGIGTKRISMHRLIMGVISDQSTIVDHRDGNGLNNQKSNLRKATPLQNQYNRKKRSNSRWKYKGVYYQEKSQKWRADICVNGKKIHLGQFDTEEEAARAYDDAARLYFGEFARLNFP